MASRPMATPRRDVANPGESLTTIESVNYARIQDIHLRSNIVERIRRSALACHDLNELHQMRRIEKVHAHESIAALDRARQHADGER